MKNYDHKRGTGRTTRMLQHAVRLEHEGRQVYIIASNRQDANRFMEMLRDMMPVETTFNFRTLQAGDIRIETPDMSGLFDWHTMKLRGTQRNCMTLVDHFAIESRFAMMLEMLVAYDDPNFQLALKKV